MINSRETLKTAPAQSALNFVAQPSRLRRFFLAAKWLTVGVALTGAVVVFGVQTYGSTQLTLEKIRDGVVWVVSGAEAAKKREEALLKAVAEHRDFIFRMKEQPQCKVPPAQPHSTRAPSMTARNQSVPDTDKFTCGVFHYRRNGQCIDIRNYTEPLNRD